ncbi:MAG TPA: hypothetical protein VF615_25295 [Longimicrobiaceae bacterium]
MRLWKLTPRHDSLWWCVDGKDPWQPHQDKAFGFVVRAESEEEARWLAHESAGGENDALPGVRPWVDEQYSTCEELPSTGRRGVVLVNFRHA